MFGASSFIDDNETVSDDIRDEVMNRGSKFVFPNSFEFPLNNIGLLVPFRKGFINNEAFAFGTAFLISPQFILTAAHVPFGEGANGI